MNESDMALALLLDEVEGISLEHKRAYRQHEKDLWGSVLIDAISILLGRIPHKRHEWIEAKRWVESDADEPGDYRWICKTLDLHHRRVRELTLANVVEPQRKVKSAVHRA